MVCGLYQTAVGEEGARPAFRKGAGELLPVEQGAQEMERSHKAGGRATLQKLRICAGA